MLSQDVNNDKETFRKVIIVFCPYVSFSNLKRVFCILFYEYLKLHGEIFLKKYTFLAAILKNLPISWRNGLKCHYVIPCLSQRLCDRKNFLV